MKDVVTIGDGMITFDPSAKGPLRFSASFERKVGGAELNFALGCARLGLETGWISCLGDDEFGRYIHNFARGEGVDVSEVRLIKGRPTSLNFKEVKEDGTGRTFYYRHQSPTDVLTADNLNENYLKESKLLHITGVFPAVNPEKNVRLIEHAARTAKENGLKVSMDPNIRLKLWSREDAKNALHRFLPYVDILMTGDEEGDVLFDTAEPDQIIAHCLEAGVETIAVKQGDQGAIAYSNGEKVQVPAFKPGKVVDTVGAGDGFDAGFIYGMMNHWSLEKTTRFANMIGAMVVSTYGDNEGLPYLDDVLVQLGEKAFIER